MINRKLLLEVRIIKNLDETMEKLQLLIDIEAKRKKASPKDKKAINARIKKVRAELDKLIEEGRNLTMLEGLEP